MEAAFRVMAEQGLLAARTADIAAAAGTAHGTVFAHFATREELLCAVVEELGRRVAERLHLLAESSRGLEEVLAAHLRGLAEFEPLYLRLVSEGRQLPQRVRSSFLMIQSAISFHLGQAAEREMEEGRVRSMPLALLFNTWIGLVHHYLINGDLFAPGRPSVLERQGAVLIAHFYGLVSREAVPDPRRKSRKR